MSWGAAISGGPDDPIEAWKVMLTKWSTDELPSVTFPRLTVEEAQEGATILAKDLASLQTLSDVEIARLSENSAHAIFEVACLKEEKTGLAFDIREALVQLAEKRTSKLNFEYWADVFADRPAGTEGELVYSAKAAKNGHEESLQWLQSEVREGNERAQALMKEYGLGETDEEDDPDAGDS